MVAEFNHFEEIGEQLHVACGQVVRKTAFDAQGNIQSVIRANGQIDTGFMINSVYVRTAQESTYTGGAKALPPVEAPPDELEAYVAVAAAYGWFQNYGTSRMAARPFFEPGFEMTRAGFEAAIAKIEELLHG